MKNSLKRTTSAQEAGFTLLEVIIALAIMVVAFTSILSVESGSINASARARQLNIVAMLAKGTMVDTELKLEGKTFEEAKKEEGGTYETPYQDYRWAATVKEIQFPQLNVSGASGSGDKKEEDKNPEGTTDIIGTMTKLVTKFLSKAVREVNVTVFWKKGTGEQKFTLSTYWVNLEQDFEVSE